MYCTKWMQFIKTYDQISVEKQPFNSCILCILMADCFVFAIPKFPLFLKGKTRVSVTR